MGTADLQEGSHEKSMSPGGITADEAKENIPHDCLESLSDPLAGAAHGSGQQQGQAGGCPCTLSYTDHPAPHPFSFGCHRLLQAAAHPQQSWVLKKSSRHQRGLALFLLG